MFGSLESKTVIFRVDLFLATFSKEGTVDREELIMDVIRPIIEGKDVLLGLKWTKL